MNVARAEETRAIARGIFERDDLPIWLVSKKREVMANSEVLSAHAHLCSSRVKYAMICLWRGIRLNPSLFFSSWTFRQLFHATGNYLYSKLLRKLVRN